MWVQNADAGREVGSHESQSPLNSHCHIDVACRNSISSISATPATLSILSVFFNIHFFLQGKFKFSLFSSRFCCKNQIRTVFKNRYLQKNSQTALVIDFHVNRYVGLGGGKSKTRQFNDVMTLSSFFLCFFFSFSIETDWTRPPHSSHPFDHHKSEQRSLLFPYRFSPSQTTPTTLIFIYLKIIHRKRKNTSMLLKNYDAEGGRGSSSSCRSRSKLKQQSYI